jgi:hypothetical protein
MQEGFILPFLLMTMALTAGAALVLGFLHWKAQRVDQRLPHHKAQRLNPGLLRRTALNPGRLHQKYSMRVSTTLLLAAMAFTLGFVAIYFPP